MDFEPNLTTDFGPPFTIQNGKMEKPLDGNAKHGMERHDLAWNGMELQQSPPSAASFIIDFGL